MKIAPPNRQGRQSVSHRSGSPAPFATIDGQRPAPAGQRELARLSRSLNQRPPVLAQMKLAAALSRKRTPDPQVLQHHPSASTQVVQRVYYLFDDDMQTWREATTDEVEVEHIPDSSESRRWVLLHELLEMHGSGLHGLLKKILAHEPGLDLVFAHYLSLDMRGRGEFESGIIDVEVKQGRVASIKELDDLVHGGEIEAAPVVEDDESFSDSGGGGDEEEYSAEAAEPEASTAHLYKPIPTDASLETLNSTVATLKVERKNLLEAKVDTSLQETVSNAINLIAGLLKQRTKKDGEAWAETVAQVNAAGAAYARAMLLVQRQQPEVETKAEEESPTRRALKSIRDEKLLASITGDGLLDDRVIKARIENATPKFGWTNAKGEVGEFYGTAMLKGLGRQRTKGEGGDRLVINVVVTETEPVDNPKRVREIDGLEVEISGKQFILRGVYEIKTTTEGKSNQRGELQTSLSKKWKALRDGSGKGYRIWMKEGERLIEDVTNKLIVPDLKQISVKSVGPVRTDKDAYDVTFKQDVNKIADQLACLWLQNHPERTVADVQIGTGKGSAFAAFTTI